MLQDIKAVIFDLDGSLVDSMWIWKDIDIEYLGRFGIELPDELQTEVVEICKIETAAWPIRIRDFMKKRTNLTSALEEVKKELRNKITKAYNETYELLECLFHPKSIPVFQSKSIPF